MPEGAAGARRSLGVPLGVVLALGVYLLLARSADSLSGAGAAVAAIGVLMATLWITESMPLPATSLLPLVLFPLAGVGGVSETAAPYAHPLIFLFMGGFMLALAIESSGLHRRVALAILRRSGTAPDRLVLGFMLVTALLSMWISNTATTIMMLPIALSVLRLLGDGSHTPLGAGLVLGIAYAASIGGMATIIGTPPNAFLVGFLESSYGIRIGFGRWLAVGLPLALVLLPVTWLILTRWIFPAVRESGAGARALLEREADALGPMSTHERRVGIVFGATALAWMLREPITSLGWVAQHAPALTRLTDAGVAMSAAVVLFALPAGGASGRRMLGWEEAARLPWGVLLLFGGGLSLARAVRESGLDEWLGAPVAGLGDVPLVVVLLVVVALIVFLTELTSNTATCATFLPVLAAAAVALDREPLLLVVPAALAASCAFMMPVATPPNAIVFGSGHVEMRQMVRAGVWLNLVAILVLVLVGVLLVPAVL